MSITTLRVACSTRERLKNQGRKGQTYDELINKLIDTLGDDTKNKQSSQDYGLESLQTGPTAGQSLERPGQSEGQKFIYGGPTDD